MGLGAPWSNSRLQHQQKENTSVMFIYQFPTNHQMFSWDQPNGPWCPLRKRLYRTPTKRTVFCEVYISIFSNNIEECLEANQCIDDDRRNKKPGTLTTTLHKNGEEENEYASFGYSLLTDF